MKWFTRKRLSAIAVTLMVIAAVFTIIDTPLGWWQWFSGGVETGATVTARQSTLPTLTPVPTIPPTSVPSLAQMLEAAKSVRTSSERNRALRIVAETAVEKGNYDVAIKAGAASPTSNARSETLTFVALCAAKEGLFALAIEAADKIPISKVHDNTKVEVLSIRSVQESSESIQAFGAPVSPDCRTNSPP